jgi:hypothetical protein
MEHGVYHRGRTSFVMSRKLNEREIHQGTKPATNPAAMTRKTADPAIANSFLIKSHVSRSLGHAQWKSVHGSRLPSDHSDTAAGLGSRGFTMQLHCRGGRLPLRITPDTYRYCPLTLAY